MKICHIIDSGGLYGAEIMLFNLILQQKKMGLKPILCSIGTFEDDVKLIESEARKLGVEVFAYRMKNGLNFVGAKRLVNKLRLRGVELLHLHGYKPDILFGYMPKKYIGIPIVTTLHGWTSSKLISRKSLYAWLDSFSLKYLDAVVVVNGVMQEIERLKKRKLKNIHVIENGIQPYDINSVNKKCFDAELEDYSKSKIVVGAIGRLSEEKGFEYLIDAVKILSKKIDKLRLVIIGEGDNRARLYKRIVDNNIESSVLLTGYKKHASDYFAYFDVFVISSLTEGLPITLLEAMNSKTPIVATRVGGIPGVLKKSGGILVNPKSAEELADAIEQVLSNNACAKQMIEFSYKEFIINYSSMKMAKKYFNLYKQLIENRDNNKLAL